MLKDITCLCFAVLDDVSLVQNAIIPFYPSTSEKHRSWCFFPMSNKDVMSQEDLVARTHPKKSMSFRTTS